MIKVKSITVTVSDDDAFRVLVEPVWPRKVSRGMTILNLWLRDLAALKILLEKGEPAAGSKDMR